MNEDTTRNDAAQAAYGSPYRELIDADRDLAQTVGGDVAALLVERAARTGFGAGLMKGVPSWQDAVLNVLSEDRGHSGVMNRYVVAGMVADAVAGRRVAYVGRRPGACLSRLELAADPVEVESVYRANGRERIAFTSGGEIALYDVHRGAPRGVVADMVVLDAEASRQDRVVEQAQSIVAKSERGEVVRA